MDRLLELLAAGRIEPRIDSIHTFDQAAAAHRLLEGRGNVGKIVLVPGTAGGLA
jgi:NADPH:quinone reductase-like Zn-dependent oxidoreductase